MNVSNLKEILEAREARAERQSELLLRGGVLISFGLNIPGPVKNAQLFRFVFGIGLHKIINANKAAKLTEQYDSPAGPCAFLLLPEGSDAYAIKTDMVQIEEQEPLGRLWDIDVLVSGGECPEKISRRAIGRPARKCLVCDAPAFVCVRAARHTVPEVLRRVVDIILSSGEVREQIFGTAENSKAGKFAERVALEALRAILYEVITTPKPGLVDAENNGSHKDMNITTFFDSAVAIAPYFPECVLEGMRLCDEAPETMLPRLRPLGLNAEQKMYKATGGVNTHKGAVFTMGVLCAAIGWQQSAADGRRQNATDVPAVAGRICSAMENGSRGIRSEAMSGYPSVREAVSEMKTALNAGFSDNAAGVRALINLIALVDDANAVRRGGEEAAEKMRRKAAEILDSAADEKTLLEETVRFDQSLIRENLSPGGAADLLAAAYFLNALENGPFLSIEKEHGA